MTFVDVFQVGLYRYIYKFATPVGMVLDHYIGLVRWEFPIRMYPENCDFFIFGNYYYYYY